MCHLNERLHVRADHGKRLTERRERISGTLDARLEARLTGETLTDRSPL